MNRIGHAETCLILPMEDHDKATLLELVRRLAPYKRELEERWCRSFMASAARPASMSEELVVAMAGEMIGTLIELPTDGRFNQYFDEMRRLSQKYVRLGVPYPSLVFAIHLYEEANLPVMAREYASVDSLQRVLIAQDHLVHNVLAIFAAAYYEGTLNELIRSNHELAGLMSIQEVGLSSRPLPEILNELIERIVKATGVRAGVIALLDESEGQLVPLASCGVGEGSLSQYRLRIGEGFIGRVAKERRPVQVRDVEGDPVGIIPRLRQIGIKSMLGVPLTLGERLVGVVHIDTTKEHEFSAEEIHLLQALADRASLAIDRARLLSELQARTQQLESRTAELEEVQQMRQEFVSMIVHEFRGPLTVIAGWAKLQAGVASRGGGCDLHVLETIQAQAKRLERLVSDLTDVSLLDSGRFEMVAAECDLVAVARKTVEEHEITTEKHRLALEASPEKIIGRWDGDRIAQAIANLVSNAIKYSPEGGQVRISVSQRDAEAVISVADQGVGISASDVDRLFEPFSRLYRESVTKGTGLGLYITKGIVHAHGGRVWVDSEEGIGSTFHIALPLRPAKGESRRRSPRAA